MLYSTSNTWVLSDSMFRPINGLGTLFLPSLLQPSTGTSTYDKPNWCLRLELNQCDRDFQSRALPAELQRLMYLEERVGVEPTSSRVAADRVRPLRHLSMVLAYGYDPYLPVPQTDVLPLHQGRYMVGEVGLEPTKP